jgi:predicted ATP-grasp superfamily ATP-dependent carboligase
MCPSTSQVSAVVDIFEQAKRVHLRVQQLHREVERTKQHFERLLKRMQRQARTEFTSLQSENGRRFG